MRFELKMANSDKQQKAEDRRIDDVDRADQVSSGDASVDVSSSGGETSNRSVTRRLAEILVEDRDADLLLQRSGREDGVIQWLRALDFQVMGACRADERLKPLLKMNASSGVADDGLLAHLSQVCMYIFKKDSLCVFVLFVYQTVILLIENEI